MKFVTVEEEDSEKRMTAKSLRKLCTEKGLYCTPHLNDKLYLMHQEYSEIENLEDYTNLKAIWLNGNAISDIKGLQNQLLLACLYLSDNAIGELRISSLRHMKHLHTINLSGNRISNVDSLADLTSLVDLSLSNNNISEIQTIVNILDAPSLSILDISRNDLEDKRAFEVLCGSKLSVLSCSENGFMNLVEDPHEKFIVRISTLKYLNRVPVNENERRLATAFISGGTIERRRVREMINKEEQQRNLVNCRFLDVIRRDAEAENTFFEAVELIPELFGEADDASSNSKVDNDRDSKEFLEKLNKIIPN